MTSSHLPKHIFISYSTIDKQFVDKLLPDLRRRGFAVWIDRMGLTPGTLDWEKDIRGAIRRSFAVVYLTSPNSKDSSTVNGELLFAKSCNCQIYPVLISGEWIDSSRLDMSNAQYIDLRGEKYEAGLSILCDALTDTISRNTPEIVLLDGERPYDLGRHWSDHFPIGLPDKKYALIRKACEISLDSLLDDLYLNFLTSYVEPFTYGSEWLLTVQHGRWVQVIQDWSWLVSLADDSDREFYNRGWKKHATLGDFGASTEHSWYGECEVATDIKSAIFVGLAFPSEDCEAHRYLQNKGEKLLMGVFSGYIGSMADAENVDHAQYPKRYIIMLDSWLMGFLDRREDLPTNGQAFVAHSLW